MSNLTDISPEKMEAMIVNSRVAFKRFHKSSRYIRSRLLSKMAEGIEARRSDLVKAMVDEVAKPVTLADGEVTRAITTFTTAAEEVKRYGGEIIPLDIEASGRNYSSSTSGAISYHVPRGPVLAIAPFNFPLNLVAHKVAPALAIGATVLLKPPPQGPGPSKILHEIFLAACDQVSDSVESIPKDAFQVFTATNEIVGLAVRDSRISTLSFTGSNTVGWMLQSLAVRKKVCLELGGNAAVIVEKDANLSRAVSRCVFGSFAYAGQVCISVQKIFVHKEVSAKFQEMFLKETIEVGVGDPWKKETLVGPMISEKEVKRLSGWMADAIEQGAKVLIGGKMIASVGSFTSKLLMEPTVFKDVPANASLSCEEAFGPIVILEEYENFSDAVKAVNASKFGLQAGVFTDSAKLQREALENLDVGGVIFNDVPTFRSDVMPYGGVKESGLGYEGVHYTMHEFSERRTAVYWNG